MTGSLGAVSLGVVTLESCLVARGMTGEAWYRVASRCEAARRFVRPRSGDTTPLARPTILAQDRCGLAALLPVPRQIKGLARTLRALAWALRYADVTAVVAAFGRIAQVISRSSGKTRLVVVKRIT